MPLHIIKSAFSILFFNSSEISLKFIPTAFELAVISFTASLKPSFSASSSVASFIIGDSLTTTVRRTPNFLISLHSSLSKTISPQLSVKNKIVLFFLRYFFIFSVSSTSNPLLHIFSKSSDSFSGEEMLDFMPKSKTLPTTAHIIDAFSLSLEFFMNFSAFGTSDKPILLLLSFISL